LYVFDHILHHEIRSVALDELHHDKLIKDILNTIIAETVDELCDELATEVSGSLEEMYEEAEAADAYRRSNLAFQIWFKAAKRSAERKAIEFEKRQERAVRFYLNVMASASGPPLVRKKGLSWVGSSSETQKWGGGWGLKAVESGFRLESVLVQAEREAESRRTEYFRHLNIPSIVFEPLLEVNKASGLLVTRGRGGVVPHIYWKLLVSTWAGKIGEGEGETREQQRQKQQETVAGAHPNRFASLWTKSKFGAGGDGSGDGAVVRGDQNGYVFDELLRVSVDMWEGGSQGRSQGKRKAKLCVFVNHVDVYGDAQYPLKVCSPISVFYDFVLKWMCLGFI
jgi:hypothetical protein